MQTNSKMTRNTVIIFLTRLVDPLIAIILVVYVARYLSLEEMGKYSFIRSYFSIFVVLAGFGLQTPLIREIACDRQKSGCYFINAAVPGSILTLGIMLLTCLVISFAGYDRDVVTGVWILSLSLLATTLNDYCRAVLAANEKFGSDTLFIILGSFIRTAASIAALLLGFGLHALLVILSLSTFLELIFKFRIIRHLLGSFRLKIDKEQIKRFLKMMPTFTFIAVLSVIYWRVDILMLSKMRGMTEVALYAAAYRLMETCKGLPLSLTRSLFPTLSRISGSDKTTACEITLKAFKWTAVMLFPLAFGTTLLSREIIFLFYDPKFADSILALQLLIWTIVPYGLAMILANLLTATNNQKFDLLANVISFVVNVVLNYALISRFGATGACVATLISIVLFLGLQHYFVRKQVFRLAYWGILWKPFLAAGLMAMTLGVFSYAGFLVRTLLGISIYGFMLILLKVVDLRDFPVLKFSHWLPVVRVKKFKTKLTARSLS